MRHHGLIHVRLQLGTRHGRQLEQRIVDHRLDRRARQHDRVEPALNERLELVGEGRAELLVGLPKIVPPVVQNLPEEPALRARRGDRRRPHRQDERDAGRRPHVSARRVVAAARAVHFRSHVAAGTAGVGHQPGPPNRREPEVGDPEAPVFSKEQVLGLYVAVKDELVVARRECVPKLVRVGPRHKLVQRAELLHHVVDFAVGATLEDQQRRAPPLVLLTVAMREEAENVRVGDSLESALLVRVCRGCGRARLEAPGSLGGWAV
mmetsp:Transcript_71117/g.199872  ORF Transcript_71117/g.199872 Transcript_71117/m.199872 type:complete len:264 (+) Transcript_71117:250-1041(+)